MVASTTAFITPIDIAAFITWNHGSTTPIITPKPCPSSPSRRSAEMLAAVAVTGDESLPRNPRPSNAPAIASPGVVRSTSHRLIPLPSRERLDQT